MDLPLDIINIIISYLTLEDLENVNEAGDNFQLQDLDFKYMMYLKYGFGYKELNCNDYNNYCRLLACEHVCKYTKVHFSNFEKITYRHYCSDYPFLIDNVKKLYKSQEIYFFNRQISVELFKLTHLQKLSVDNCKLKIIPKEISCLTNLKFLDLSTNKIKYITPEICNLRKLKKLFLSENEIETIPTGISNLINLKTINLSFNSIKNINNLCPLINLEYILMQENKIEYIPNEFSKLLNLKYFHCLTDYIKELPDDLLLRSKLRK